MQKALFTSNKQTWETPIDLFNKLNEVFHFNIDLCAEDSTAKCELYYTPTIDGLNRNWCSMNYWMNPPYGREQIQWIVKASNDSMIFDSTIVCLIPARPDTKVWQDIIFPTARAVCFLRGRLKFGNSKDAAPFPSALIVFGNNITNEQIGVLNSLGHLILYER